MGSLFTEELIQGAWKKVCHLKHHSRTASEGIREYERSADERTAVLTEQLQQGTFRASPATTDAASAADWQQLTLSFPAAEDLVVAQAVYEIIRDTTDRQAGCSSYAFRHGLSASAAVQEVAMQREVGMSWVVHAKLDTAPSLCTLAALTKHNDALKVPPEVYLALTDLLPHITAATEKSFSREHAAPGYLLFRLLVNAVLSKCDHAFHQAGFPVVRYAENLLLFATSRSEATSALPLLHKVIGELDMKCGLVAAKVWSFRDGFCFLGTDFDQEQPPCEMFERNSPSTEKRPLFVSRQGSRICSRRGRLVVEDRDTEQILDVPQGSVDRIVCFGSVGLTTGARSWALRHGVPVVLASRRGSYLGTLVGAGSEAKVSRLRAQITASDDAPGVAIARAMITAKVAKQEAVLRRFQQQAVRKNVNEAVAALRDMSAMLPNCTTRGELMGVEGAAAAAYFPA